MAIPSAVRRQRERLEAEFSANNTDQGAPAPDAPVDLTLALVPTATEPAPQVPDAPPAQDNEVAALKARVAELDHLLRTRDGQASTSAKEVNEARQHAQMLAAQVANLEEAVAELGKQKDTAESIATARRAQDAMPALDDVSDLTPAEVEQFGQDSVSFVQKLSKKELLAFVKPLVARLEATEKAMARLSDLDRLPQLEKVVSKAAADSQAVKDEEFFRKEVLAYFPDFETVRDTPKWVDYLNSDIPGKGIQIKHHLQQLRLQHNAPGIRSILQVFYDEQKEKPSLASLAVPSKTQTEGTPVVKPKLKASQYQLMLKRFTSKQLGKPEWDAFKTDFNAAYAEGRVEMDARL